MHMTSLICIGLALVAGYQVLNWIEGRTDLPNEVTVAIVTLMVRELVVKLIEIAHTRTTPPEEPDIKDKMLMSFVESHLAEKVARNSLEATAKKLEKMNEE